MFELQNQRLTPEPTLSASVLRWRRKPMFVGLHLIGLAICLGFAFLLVRFDLGDPVLSWVFVGLPMWLGFLLVCQLLTGCRTVEVRPEGICFRSLVTARSLPWEGIDGIRFKYVARGAEPLARTILLKIGSNVELLEEYEFLAGRMPLLDAILSYWRPPVGSSLSVDWLNNNRRARIRRYGFLGSACSLATMGTFSALKLTGVLATCFSWTAIVLVPIALFLGGAVWFSVESKCGSRKNPDAFHDVADLHQVSIPRPSAIQGNPKTAFANSLFCRFLPPPPEMLLPEEQIHALRHRMTRLDQQATRLCLILLLGLVAIFTYAPYRLDLALQEAVLEPVLDTRSNAGFLWLLPGMFLGMMAVIVVLEPFLSLWYGREAIRLYSRYQTTLKGYDERRAMRYLCGFCMVFVVFGSLVAWRNGYVVDRSGIRFKPGFVHSYRHSYSDVQSIGVYRRFGAPAGIQERPRIRITFREGPSLVESLQPSDKRLPEWLRAVEYVSQRSGVPVEHGDMAPKD